MCLYPNLDIIQNERKDIILSWLKRACLSYSTRYKYLKKYIRSLSNLTTTTDHIGVKTTWLSV